MHYKQPPMREIKVEMPILRAVAGGIIFLPPGLRYGLRAIRSPPITHPIVDGNLPVRLENLPVRLEVLGANPQNLHHLPL